MGLSAGAFLFCVRACVRACVKFKKMEPGVPKMTLDLGTDLGADRGTRIGPDFLRFSVMLGASRSPDDLRLDM